MADSWSLSTHAATDVTNEILTARKIMMMVGPVFPYLMLSVWKAAGGPAG